MSMAASVRSGRQFLMSFVRVLTTSSKGRNGPSEQANDRGSDGPNDHGAAAGPGCLRCQVSRERDTARIQAVGELDLATVPILDAELAALRDAGCRRLILDLSGLAFMDSTGLRCILRYDAEARQDGFSIALIPGPPAVQRVFQVTDTEARLPFIRP